MTNDPINTLVLQVLDRHGLRPGTGLARVTLADGFALIHNRGPTPAMDDGSRVRPAATLVRQHGLMVGMVSPWGWSLGVDEDRLRAALFAALREPAPPLEPGPVPASAEAGMPVLRFPRQAPPRAPTRIGRRLRCLPPRPAA